MIKERNEKKKEYEDQTRKGDTDSASRLWKEFKKIRNKINNRKKFEEKNFKSNKILSSLTCPSDLWRTTKSFMDWEKTGGPPVQLLLDGVLVTKPYEIAKEMNKYFLDKVNTIRSGIADLPNLLLGPARIMQNKNCHVDFDTVPVSKVNRILKSMKNSKSTSIDQLDNFCIKVAADIIDSPLHHVICLSIAQQKFPSKWKLSKVIPLHKKQCVLDKKKL